MTKGKIQLTQETN